MGDANTLNLDPEREKALSDQLAQQALDEQASDENLLSTVVEIGRKIVDAIKVGAEKTKETTKDVYDELRDVSGSLEEKLDDVVGFIVDPIRQSLSGLKDDLTKGLDPVTAAGIVVGAVYALRDEIWDGFKWLWNHWDVALMEGWDILTGALSEGWELLKGLWPYMEEGLLKLGEVITGALDMGWEWIKSVAPDVVDGLADIGDWVWDKVPDWLKTGLEFIHDVYTTLLKVPARIGGYISDGLEAVFRAIGLDTLGDVMNEIGEVLHGIADWLGLTTEEEAAPAKRGLTSAETAMNISVMEGTIKAHGGPAASVYDDARILGLTAHQAAHLSSLADTNLAATQAAMAALQTAVEGGMDPSKAYELAFQEFKANYVSRSRFVAPAAPEVMTGGLSGVASDRATAVAAARETNATLKRVAALQEKAIRDQESRASMAVPEVVDTVSSDDTLTAFGTGRMGGGMT